MIIFDVQKLMFAIFYSNKKIIINKNRNIAVAH